ncbi:MAG: hypothetical protein HYV99_02775 [Betaproteobacteria bacterium]|nr:hypothetical protein [Betaproteobacteria bacterium]
MRLTRISFILFAGAVLAHGAAAADDGGYAGTLGHVYGAHQRIIAMKEACGTAVPDTRAANEKAYTGWRSRHAILIRDLEKRLVAMVRLASKDEKDYARNLGKYEGEILQTRQEYRQTLLALGAEELRHQCQRWPDFLRGPEADFRKVYAAELATIHKHK